VYEYRATVERVVDGDTVDLDIDLGLDVHAKERCRLYGIDTPEMRGESRPLGIEARDFLVEMVLGREVVAQTIKDRRGKYGRYLVALFLESGDDLLDVNQALIEAGHAVVYEP